MTQAFRDLVFYAGVTGCRKRTYLNDKQSRASTQSAARDPARLRHAFRRRSRRRAHGFRSWPIFISRNVRPFPRGESFCRLTTLRRRAFPRRDRRASSSRRQTRGAGRLDPAPLFRGRSNAPRTARLWRLRGRPQCVRRGVWAPVRRRRPERPCRRPQRSLRRAAPALLARRRSC